MFFGGYWNILGCFVSQGGFLGGLRGERWVMGTMGMVLSVYVFLLVEDFFFFFFKSNIKI